MRIGRVGLAAYLKKINPRESAKCGCDLGSQTVEHAILECPLLNDQRSTVRGDLAERGVSMTLGHEELLRQAVAAPLVADFMIKSGLLAQFVAVDSVATGVKNTGEKGKT